MIISQAIKDKYLHWQYLVSLLPLEIIAVAETELGEIVLETESHNIYISPDIFTDDLVLNKIAKRQIAASKAS